jgi:hypothetical protein
MQSSRRALSLLVSVVFAMGLPSLAAGRSPTGLVEVTDSRAGQDLAAEAAARQSTLGERVDAGDLRVWRIAPGDYLVGKTKPRNLAFGSVTGPAGKIEPTFSFDVGARVSNSPHARSAALATASPSWVWVNQGCFTRISNIYGWLDSCFKLLRLAGESDSRDFYTLEQYGSVGAQTFGKIYSGWLAASRSSASAPMAWIDWSPRGSKSGPCAVIPLSVSALGQSFSASGLMCERWNVYKYSAAGHFKEEWSCGCIFPFGQPHPNVREIDYLQTVSVANGRYVEWTLSAGFLAR